MNSKDEKLDQLLTGVQPRAASPGLADRIISAAETIDAGSERSDVIVRKADESESILALIANSLTVFKPAPIMACLLVAGVLSGWYMENGAGLPDQASQQTNRQESSLAVEDELLDFIDYELSML